MKTISVYLNSHASQADAKFQIDDIRRQFQNQTITFEYPQSHEEVTTLLKRDTERGVDCIFSIGGDGTIHSIAQSIVGTKTKIMVLAGGTANDFATEVGTNSSLHKISQIFQNQQTKDIDVIKINERYMVTNGGLGIASFVAKKINTSRKKNKGFLKLIQFIGKHIYSLCFVKEVLSSPLEFIEVYIDSPDFPLIEKRIKSPLILVNNQKILAGKFPVAPDTRNNDGIFNVTIFLHQSKIDFIKSSIFFLLGQFPKFDKQIIQFETKQLKLTSLTNKDLEFFGDGENFLPSKELDISIIPKGMIVFSDDENLQKNRKESSIQGNTYQ